MSVLYLYGFTDEATALPERGLLGVGDAEVELVALDGVAAIVARLESPGYEESALERSSGDVAWMAEQGLRHEQVVAWFVDHARILPSRLLTLFTDLEALRAEVGARTGRIRDRLDRFGEVDEWDLKVSADQARLLQHIGEVSDTVAALDREIAEATPGKRFLLEKKRTDLARGEGRRAAGRLAGELLERLGSMAEDVVRLEPPGDAAPVTLNAALLIGRARRGEVRDALAREVPRLEQLGLTVHLTGPWAPYRFLAAHE